MMKKLCLSLVFLSLLAGLVTYCGHIMRPTESDKVMKSIDTFHSLEENSVDVLALGSSKCHRGFDSVEFEKRFGVSVYNYGGSWQQLGTSWLLAYDAFQTQKPEVVFIETYLISDAMIDVDVDGQIWYTKRIPWSDAKKEFLERCFGSVEEHYGRYLDYFLPLLYSHENWEGISEGSFRRNSCDIDFLANRGFDPNYEVSPIEILSEVDDRKLSDEAKMLVDDIVELCHDNGADVVFFSAPFVGPVRFPSYFKQYAQENGCYYLNFFEHMEESGIDPETDFADMAHLNDKGAAKVADYLGEYLIELGIMPEGGKNLTQMDGML